MLKDTRYFLAGKQNSRGANNSRFLFAECSSGGKGRAGETPLRGGSTSPLAAVFISKLHRKLHRHEAYTLKGNSLVLSGLFPLRNSAALTECFLFEHRS